MTITTLVTPLAVFFVVLSFLAVMFLCTAETFNCVTERTLHVVTPNLGFVLFRFDVSILTKMSFLVKLYFENNKKTK
jgi:hypothetical protein